MIKEIESHSLEDYLLKEKNLQNENGITDAVREIIQEVKDSGNEALLKFINKKVIIKNLNIFCIIFLLCKLK